MRVLLLLVCIFSVSLHAADKIVSFDRPLKPGTHFECNIVTEQSARYTFQLKGNPDPVIRLENVTASFGGYLTILKVNASGNPVLMKIRVQSLTGALNGKTIAVSCVGQTILADLSGKIAVFTTPDRKKLSIAETALFSALFHPALDNKLSDLTGNTHVLPKPKQGWPLKTDKFLQTLRQRKIQAAPSAIQTGITYQGKEKFQKETCLKFSMLIETIRSNDYDFRFKATFLLAPDGPIRSLNREAVEIVHRKIASSHPFAAGATVELRSHDRTEQRMRPVKKLPVEQMQHKVTPWESLLH